MAKLFTLFTSILLIASCASRKVDVSNASVSIKTDSVVVIKTDSSVVTQNNIVNTEKLEEFEIKPLHDSLPIVIDGTSYYNAVIKYKKQNRVLIDTSKKTESKKALKSITKKKQESKKTKEKSVEKKANYFVYLWLLIIPIGIIIYRELKKKIFL